MTPYSKVYDAFLARILEDEWGNWSLEEAERDWKHCLDAAKIWFKFPRVDLDGDENGFFGDLGNEEIQILANYMKCEWLNRSIMTWENIKPLYAEKDFSQANLLDKLKAMLEREEAKAAKAESNYYRAIKGKPFNYRMLSENAN